MFKLKLSAICILLLVLAHLLSACAVNIDAHEQLQTEQVTKQDQNQEANMKQPNDNNLENENQNCDQKQVPTDNTTYEKAQAFEIILKVSEVSEESFTEKFGQDYVTGDPVLANAVRIADCRQALFVSGFDYRI